MTTSEQFPVNSSITKLITTTTTSKPTTQSNSSSYSAQQPKSFKFTLISGKFWKFNVKASSLTDQKEGELRLHKNLSHSYLIDDDSWFQYNPKEQQLFAWPNLLVKPGTYHYVLLPSSVDIEADSENNIHPDIVASIVVELIRPLYPDSKSDYSTFIDHKFSLDYLHRHPAYPLLLQQIISIFDTLTRSNPSQHQQNMGLASNQTAVVPSVLLTQQKSSKLSNKLGEYLLINSSYSPDGELFSISWSTVPSLVNNTVTQISECRITTINDTVSRLSSSSSGYLKEGDKYIVHYPFETPSASSQALAQTGNYSLTLTLYGPCQRSKLIMELGITSMGKNLDPIPDIDDKENNMVESQAASLLKQNVVTDLPGLPTPEAIDSSTGMQTSTAPQFSSIVTHPPISVTTTAPIVSSSPPQDLQSTTQPSETRATSFGAYDPGSNQTANGTQMTSSEYTTTMQPQLKMQSQAKSFVSFLDLDESKPRDPVPSSVTEPRSPSNITKDIDLAATNSSVSIVPTKSTGSLSESSLNEDFIGILNDVMEYLVSVAIPVSIIIGSILLISILIALCSLCVKRRKSKQFQVRNRFNFRYGSERRAFLKNSSKPVILDADQKSLSMGGTPQHRNKMTSGQQNKPKDDDISYLPMQQLSTPITDQGNIIMDSTYIPNASLPPPSGENANQDADPEAKSTKKVGWFRKYFTGCCKGSGSGSSSSGGGFYPFYIGGGGGCDGGGGGYGGGGGCDGGGGGGGGGCDGGGGGGGGGF